MLDRVTGKPVWPIEERPVPTSDVPGERTVADAAVSDQAAALRSSGPDDGRPHRLHAGAAGAEAIEILKHYALGPLFTPPSVAATGADGTKGTLQLPGATGGALDRRGVRSRNGMLMSRRSRRRSRRIWCLGDPTPTCATSAARASTGRRARRACRSMKPPGNGRITAINLNTGRARLDGAEWRRSARPSGAQSARTSRRSASRCTIADRDPDPASRGAGRRRRGSGDARRPAARRPESSAPTTRQPARLLGRSSCRRARPAACHLSRTASRTSCCQSPRRAPAGDRCAQPSVTPGAVDAAVGRTKVRPYGRPARRGRACSARRRPVAQRTRRRAQVRRRALRRSKLPGVFAGDRIIG